jgi:hypothetical protein
MPSILEYWTTMPYSTCNNYLKRYIDVAALKAGIQRHAFSNGVQINIGENINDIGRFRQAIPKQKRPIAKNISEVPPPKRARIVEVFNELRIENAQVSMQIEEPQAAVVDENTQIEELQAAGFNAPPVTAFNCVRKPLVLNGITIEVDSMTLMVNATQMCSAAGKLFGHYRQLESTETLLQELYFVMEISSVGLIFSNIGGRPELEGTWVHRYVAYDLARWISAEIFLQYTMWMDELYIENYTLLTQIEELQAAVVDALPAIAVNGARKPLVLNGITIEVDPQTLIMNATQMCGAAGKLFGNYRRLDSTEQFLKELSSDIGIPILELYEKTKGGRGTSQDTWVDWRVALHLAQWLSPAVQVQVTRWIGELRIATATVIDDLQAAVVDAPPAIVIDDLQIAAVDISPAVITPPAIVAVNAPPAIAINGARKPLVLNGITIEVDPRTLMVNATQMCRAVGKLFGNYRRLDSTEEFLQELSSVIHICITGLIHTIQGGRPELQGTWVDWRVALHLAQWLSPAVQVQVTGWLGELMLTGRVELGNEMSPQQLDNAWQQRVQEEQARHQQATEMLETRHQQATEALETRITTMERQGELAEQKTREELDAAIKTLARDTEQMPQLLDGANVLYAGYIGNWLIKYGQSSNLTRRLAEHRRHYPEFMLIKALPCDNAVASEKKLREFVAKENIGGNYNNEKEIIGFKTQEDVYKIIGAMQKSCKNRSADNAVELKRIEAEVEIKRIKAEVEMKRMDVEKNKIETEVEMKRLDVEKNKIETMRMKMIADKIITFEQYLQMK